MVPPHGHGLVAPNLVVGPAVVLGQALDRGGDRHEAELALGRHLVPVLALFLGEAPGIALGLPASLAESSHCRLGDCREHDRLVLGVVGDSDAEPAQLVGQDRLEVGAKLMHPVVQPLGVKGANSPVRGDD